MLYNAIDPMFKEVGIAEKRFKTRLLNGAFCRKFETMFMFI